MSHSSKGSDSLTILSANVRGFQTNIGDLTHSHVIPHNPDIIATVETFLNPTVPENFGQISGFSKWHRKDRTNGTFGGVAVCFRKALSVQLLEIDMPDHLELMFFRLWLTTQETVLLCVCYRPQWQGGEPIEFLLNNLDGILHHHTCKNILIVGDLNQHLVARSFEDLLTIHGLNNHVDFPTHISGSSLDPVISDLPEGAVSCRSIGAVGSSDHYAIFSRINLKATREEALTRTIWSWNKGCWQSFRSVLENTAWDSILTGDVNTQAFKLTETLKNLQERFIPHKSYKVKAGDQPWFGHTCRLAAEEKSRAWIRFKRNPSTENKLTHKAACKRMKQVQKWAIEQWRQSLSTKLTNRSIGSKDWWSLVKQQQGLTTQDCIPPLYKPDGNVATSSQDKAELLASFFSQKMRIREPDRTPPQLPSMTNQRLNTLVIRADEVKYHLLKTEVNKAFGPDNVSPHILKKCADQLATPLATLFQNCLQQQKWPAIWKQARVVPVHKKKSQALPENYRPISLLSIIGKIYEKILVNRMTSFFDSNHLLSSKQFGFRSKRSASDLLLQLVTNWNKSLDAGKETYVVALDIAGAFDRVWHEGIISKLKSFGIDGDLLKMIQDYLRGRTLQVVVNGYTSSEHPISASVPQGSVIGPLLWNVYFNDILHLIPEAHAYADDCTLSFTCEKHERAATAEHINNKLSLITSWGRRWQVTLAPDKTQVMFISRRQSTLTPSISVDGKTLDLTKEINILGVQFDNQLTFTSHVKDVAKRAARKLACVRRISHLLDSRGCCMLYNSQVRSLMEYSPLVWSSSPPSFLTLLDRVQNQARRLVEFKMRENDRPVYFQSLQHRRDVAALCVFYKVHQQNSPHLATLRLQPEVPSTYNTRNSHSRSHELHVPFARTQTFLRTFLPKYSRMWNQLVRETDLQLSTSLQQFKTAVHLWRLQYDFG